MKLPDFSEGAKEARAGFTFWFQLPNTDPPFHVIEAIEPDEVAPVIGIKASGVLSHLTISVPAKIAGISDQLITRVEVAIVAAHTPVPVTVRVAVKLPELPEGVKVAKAALGSCIHEPDAAPPDQISEIKVPPAAAPV
jgi:hypothetical protein